jgi:hypothetical protein
MTLETINEVEKELERFSKRLQEAKIRFTKDKWAYAGCKESGALKRSALDLKNELTKLTPPQND